MTNSVELQVISKLLTTDDLQEIDRLLAFDDTYFAVFKEQIQFIHEHKDKYGAVPDTFTFLAQFENITLVDVDESIKFLEDGMRKNKQQILLLETFNKLTDLGEGDVTDAWEYLKSQCDRAEALDTSAPMDIIQDAFVRTDEIIKFSKQTRIPTGFKEIDECMYGGLSTVEELCILLARTNSGKSWVCTKFMESAQLNGFNVLYYSPEMQSSFIGARFDTWRAHFKNSDIQRGIYSDEYFKYLKDLTTQGTKAFVVEDKDMSEGRTTVRALETLVKKHHIQLCIIDGLSYMSDIHKADRDVERYKNICNDLFRMSKQYGCAVVIAMQANRETKDNMDEKGVPFPKIENIEGSDHPARIATQVFALRNIFDTHTMEIRLEKSRNAKNSKQVFAYTWDPNTGSTEYVEDGSSSSTLSQVSTAVPAQTLATAKIVHTSSDDELLDNDTDDLEDVEF